MRSLTSRSRRVFLWNIDLLSGLNLADFNSVGADEITVARDDNGSKVVATGGELEIAGGFEFAGELDAGVDGIGADKGRVGVDQGELVGDTFVGRH